MYLMRARRSRMTHHPCCNIFTASYGVNIGCCRKFVHLNFYVVVSNRRYGFVSAFFLTMFNSTDL